jgi:hypothetical protein
MDLDCRTRGVVQDDQDNHSRVKDYIPVSTVCINIKPFRGLDFVEHLCLRVLGELGQDLGHFPVPPTEQPVRSVVRNAPAAIKSREPVA